MDTRILEFASRHKSAQESGLYSLCRFLSFNDDPESVAKHKLMLTDGWLYHTTSDTLNDPHDLRFDLKWPKLEDTEEIEGFLNDVKLILSLMDSKQIRKGLTLQDLLRDDSIKTNLNSALKSLYNQVRVCCFTTDNENPLFWAHYANSHKGYCIRFRVNNNPQSIFSNTRKIHYSRIYPTIKFPILTTLIS